jgi:radical SAM protein with 4Fe4S-binding SPASM domain
MIRRAGLRPSTRCPAPQGYDQDGNDYEAGQHTPQRQIPQRGRSKAHRILEALLDDDTEAGISNGRKPGDPTPLVLAGDTLLTLLPSGDAYPCRRMPIRAGNLQDTLLAELYYQNDLLCALRDRSRTSEGCQDCCFARLCRGGLKCLAYAVTGDPFQADPSCWLAERADGPEGRCDCENYGLLPELSHIGLKAPERTKL